MILKLSEQRFREHILTLEAKAKVFVPDNRGVIVPFEINRPYNFSQVPVWGPSKEFVLPLETIITSIPEDDHKQLIVIGSRACDMRAQAEILDKVFLEKSPIDPVYKFYRERILFITADCQSPKDSCFCSMLDGKPYDTSFSDISLTVIKEDVVLESLSKKGREFLKELDATEADADMLALREEKRRTALRRIASNKYFEPSKVAKLMLLKDQGEYWLKEAKNCINCGACNYVCPSCYCTFLQDHSSGKNVIKISKWDSCQIPGYAKMADGSDPLEEKGLRFRHRFYCKFISMKKEFNIYGCTGCGRCILACPGKIDLRDVLTE